MRYFLLFTICLLSSPLCAQTLDTITENQIRAKLDTYFVATDAKDWDAVLDMIYPKLFELAPRESVRQQFSSLEGGGMDFSFFDVVIGDMTNPVDFEAERFILLDYSHKMGITLIDTSMQAAATSMLSLFQGQYGEDKVTYDESKNAFTVQVAKKMLAVSPIDSSDWRFVDFDPKNSSVLTLLIPEAVQKQLLPEGN